MNCYLPWNLKDMTNISAEKLQRNISQQVSYMELYRAELIREAQRFNIASILKYACTHKDSFGTDALSRKASDCMIVFLHAMAVQKGNSFTPSDSESSLQSKGCRNIHRLMLENLKATMRYIDYSMLLSHAHGEADVYGMISSRDRRYTEVFPDNNLFYVCEDERINDGFMSVIDQEESGSQDFLDFEVRRAASFSDSFCDMFAATPGSMEGFEDSEYGIIGSSLRYLEKPFIKVSGYYFSFVTRYSLENIRKALVDYVPEQESVIKEVGDEIRDDIASDDESDSDESVMEESVEDEHDEDDAVEEPCAEEETEIAEPEADTEAEPEPEPEVGDVPADETVHDVIETLPETPSEVLVEKEEAVRPDEAYGSGFEDDEYAFDDDDLTETDEGCSDSFYYETDEYEYPDEFEEDYSNSSEPDPNESSSVYDDSDEADEVEFGESEQSGEYVPYSSESLFSIPEAAAEEAAVEEIEAAEEVEAAWPEVAAEETAVEVETSEEIVESEPEEVVEKAEPYVGVEVSEPEVTSEEVEAAEPEEAVEEEPDVLPLLDLILKYSPSKNNAITQYVSGISFQQQKELIHMIDMARKAWLADRKDKMFTIPDTGISVAIFSSSQDPMMKIQRQENIGAVMISEGRDSWNSLELSFNEVGTMINASYVHISRNSFSDWEWRVVEKIGQKLIERRKSK